MAADIIVSVVISVYNGERYLSETLKSVTQQTGFGPGGTGIEIIIIDDASTDGSAEIIKRSASELEQKGFSVRSIFHTKNMHSVRSYTEGVSFARGKYFKILDHDDVLASPHSLAEPVKLMELMESRGCNVGVVFSKALYMDHAGKIFGEKRFPFPFLRHEAANGLISRTWGQFVILFSPLYPFVHGASVVRKACWEDLSSNYRLKHNAGLFDVLFAIHAMHSRKWRVAYLRTPALNYRIHSSSFTQNVRDRKTWVEILNAEYESLYGKRMTSCLLLPWTRTIQSIKSLYHKIRGGKAFKAIAVFGHDK